MDTPNPVFDGLNLQDWNYGRLFDPPGEIHVGPSVEDEIEHLVTSAELDKHPFFQQATTNSKLIELWVTQELVTTNAFSQIVLAAAGRLLNVHQRAILTEVAYGEHGKMRKGLARAAHPWLLEQMRASLGIERAEVVPAAPTVQFISRLSSSVSDPLAATAYIGVGNERLIEPEYRAVEKCFDLHFSETEYRPFLHANINEDIVHSKLCYQLADSQIETFDDRQRFVQFAADAIQSRVRYFDELLAL